MRTLRGVTDIWSILQASRKQNFIFCPDFVYWIKSFKLKHNKNVYDNNLNEQYFNMYWSALKPFSHKYLHFEVVAIWYVTYLT